MKNLLLYCLFSVVPLLSFSQNQQGYIYVLDDTPTGAVYYMSPFLDCSFPGDHDGIDEQRIRLDEQFKKYVEENYELVNYSLTQNDWLEPGRGIVPEVIYDKKIENLPVIVEGSTVIIVTDFVAECDE